MSRKCLRKAVQKWRRVASLTAVSLLFATAYFGFLRRQKKYLRKGSVHVGEDIAFLKSTAESCFKAEGREQPLVLTDIIPFVDGSCIPPIHPAKNVGRQSEQKDPFLLAVLVMVAISCCNIVDVDGDERVELIPLVDGIGNDSYFGPALQALAQILYVPLEDKVRNWRTGLCTNMLVHRSLNSFFVFYFDRPESDFRRTGLR